MFCFISCSVEKESKALQILSKCFTFELHLPSFTSILNKQMTQLLHIPWVYKNLGCLNSLIHIVFNAYKYQNFRQVRHSWKLWHICKMPPKSQLYFLSMVCIMVYIWSSPPPNVMCSQMGFWEVIKWWGCGTHQWISFLISLYVSEIWERRVVTASVAW